MLGLYEEESADLRGIASHANGEVQFIVVDFLRLEVEVAEVVKEEGRLVILVDRLC